MSYSKPFPQIASKKQRRELRFVFATKLRKLVSDDWSKRAVLILAYMMIARKPKRWSQDVTERSDALDLEKGVFTFGDPKKIAASLKRSAEASTRRKANPFRSAMSMLVFYMNRAGKNLSDEDRARLNAAKNELRRAFGRAPATKG